MKDDEQNKIRFLTLQQFFFATHCKQCYLFCSGFAMQHCLVQILSLISLILLTEKISELGIQAQVRSTRWTVQKLKNCYSKAGLIILSGALQCSSAVFYSLEIVDEMFIQWIKYTNWGLKTQVFCNFLKGTSDLSATYPRAPTPYQESPFSLKLVWKRSSNIAQCFISHRVQGIS